MKLPIQHDRYDRRQEQNRSGIIEREFQRLLGLFSEVRYEDLRFPASAINPPGAASDPIWDNTTPGWLFDGSTTPGTTMILQFVAQLSHTWKEGTPLEPHIHWSKTDTGSGNVEWIFDYKWASIGEVLDSSWTQVTEDEPVAGTPDTNTADKHLITSFGEISAAGKQISDILLMKVTRTPTGSNDTYESDARFWELDIHFQVDSRGSTKEYVKE